MSPASTSLGPHPLLSVTVSSARAVAALPVQVPMKKDPMK
jgi:hypothetical protein